MPTSAGQQAVATGTVIKTMLQLATPSTRQCQLISWGFSLSGQPAGGEVELIQTDVAATVTAHVAAGIQPLTPGMPASLMVLGTSASGYTASAEGSPASVRVFDAQTLGSAAGNNELNYSYQFMPDERPIVAVSTFLRVRATLNTTENMQCWVCWDE